MTAPRPRARAALAPTTAACAPRAAAILDDEPGDRGRRGRVARDLLEPWAMKLFAGSLLLFLALSVGRAHAAPAATPDVFKARVAIRDGGASRTFELTVAPRSQCAIAREKAGDRELEIRLCPAPDGTTLDVDWSARSPRGELRAISTLALAHGSSAELGPTDGPRLALALQ